MSYEIVKALKVDEKAGEVWLKSDSNNVTPKSFEWWQCSSLSKILQEQGKKEVEKEILFMYWQGTLQETNNLYEKSVKYSRYCLPYTWANTGPEHRKGSVWCGDYIQYSNNEVKEALYQKYLEYKKRDKSKHCIYLPKLETFLRSKQGRLIRFATFSEHAKQFNSYEDAYIYSTNIGIKTEVKQIA